MIHWSRYTYALCKALHLSSRNANSELYFISKQIGKITLDFDMVSPRSRQIDCVTASSLVGTRYLKEFLLERRELRYATDGKRTKGKAIMLLTSLASQKLSLRTVQFLRAFDEWISLWKMHFSRTRVTKLNRLNGEHLRANWRLARCNVNR